MEKEKMGRDFSRERDALYDECEEFIEELLNDVGKPWYPIKSRVEWILEQIPHASDIKKLEEYDRALKEARAEVERIKDETAEDGFEYAYRIFLRWLKDMEGSSESRERKIDNEMLQFYRRLDELYDECELFMEELTDDIGKPWYYSAKRMWKEYSRRYPTPWV